jgi:type II secretory pathway pseudopilin PulG
MTTIAPRRLPEWTRTGGLRAGAVLLGAGVPASGFTPFNHADDVLALAEHPWRLVLMPPVLLAGLAVLGAVVAPARGPSGRTGPVAFGAALLLLAASLSLLGTDDQTRSGLLLVTAVLAPVALFLGLRSSALPRRLVAISFLVATVVLLARADLVFLLQEGLPTGDTLFRAKFANRPYDFHYFGLQNPNHTAAFVILPLALAAFWARDRRLPGLARTALVTVAAICLFTLVLLFIRSGILLGVLIVLGSFATSRRRLVLGVVVALVLGGAALAASPSVSGYLTGAGALEEGSSGQVRLESIKDGAATAIAYPLTGLGLGHFERQRAAVPSHSSIVQAGAEMGLGGMAALTLLTIALLASGVRVARRHGWSGLQAGAAVGVAAYVIQTVFLAGVNAGLANGFVSIWSLSVALLLVIAGFGRAREESEVSAETAGWRGDPTRWVRSKLAVHPLRHLGLVSIVTVSLTIFSGVAVGAFGSSGETRLREAEVARAQAAAASRARRLEARARFTREAQPLNKRFYRASRSLEGRVLRTPPSPRGAPATWSFAAGLPAGWSAEKGTDSRSTEGGLQVTTGGGRLTYQLLSPVLQLPPGSFEVAAEMQVRSGGVDLLVLDVARNEFVASTLHSARATRRRRVAIGDRFTTSRPTRVRVILSNWAGVALPSTWQVDSVGIYLGPRARRRAR